MSLSSLLPHPKIYIANSSKNLHLYCFIIAPSCFAACALRKFGSLLSSTISWPLTQTSYHARCFMYILLATCRMAARPNKHKLVFSSGHMHGCRQDFASRGANPGCIMPGGAHGCVQSKLQFGMESTKLFAVATLEGKGCVWFMQMKVARVELEWSLAIATLPCLEVGWEPVKLTNRCPSTHARFRT